MISAEILWDFNPRIFKCYAALPFNILHPLQHDCNKSLEIFRCTLHKICVSSMLDTKFFASFYDHLLENFNSPKKINWIFISVVLETFPRSSKIYPWTLFSITSNRKLGCGYNLSISRIFHYDFHKLHFGKFFYYVEMGLFKEF